MGRVIVLNSYSKAGITGGAFEALSANSGDSLSVFAFNAGNAWLLDAWGIDSDSVAEFGIRSPRFHDNTRGIRLASPSLVGGGAGTVGATDMLPGIIKQPLYSSDTLIVEVNGTASDDALLSVLFWYDDVDGLAQSFETWAGIQPRIVNILGIKVAPTASGTPGAYGATRALNADDDRLMADTKYALLGVTSTLAVTTFSIKGPDTANLRVGQPLGLYPQAQASFFADLSMRENLPTIPVLKANNKASTFIEIADGEASTAPVLDLVLAQLSS